MIVIAKGFRHQYALASLLGQGRMLRLRDDSGGDIVFCHVPYLSLFFYRQAHTDRTCPCLFMWLLPSARCGVSGAGWCTAYERATRCPILTYGVCCYHTGGYQPTLAPVAVRPLRCVLPRRSTSVYASSASIYADHVSAFATSASVCAENASTYAGLPLLLLAAPRLMLAVRFLCGSAALSAVASVQFLRCNALAVTSDVHDALCSVGASGVVHRAAPDARRAEHKLS